MHMHALAHAHSHATHAHAFALLLAPAHSQSRTSNRVGPPLTETRCTRSHEITRDHTRIDAKACDLV
eukprot:6203620-Pleurochrysis_carterae.AAC.4